MNVFNMPPVPKVIFVAPLEMHAWPINDDCWSPISAAIGGEFGKAVALPMTPVEATIVGRVSMSTRNKSQSRGDAAFVAV
ncbi:MAG: hypothetical protein EBS27_05145 [Actinobacteria bacterium]|nr:hypothetical protein [Actinomycetota bacterium]